MFHHVKQLQFDARVSKPDAQFAGLLLEQFGGGNGELKAAMQYFVQSFAAKIPYPDKYDLLMDIATEELGHLEIVGATITMLLNGMNGELKNAVEQSYLSDLLQGDGQKDEMVHQMVFNPQFAVLTGGGPALTDSHGFPWIGHYVNANGDLTVDLRSNIAAESRAKIVYEYLLKFTDDPEVQRTLRFLMTREIAHFQQFTAALMDIVPNFPPGIRQGDPNFTHVYFNMSEGGPAQRGLWNQGSGPWTEAESWQYIEQPIEYVEETAGLRTHSPEGIIFGEDEVQQANEDLSEARSQEIKAAVKASQNRWSDYS